MEELGEPMRKNAEPWYAVKSVFYHRLPAKYEERIVLFRAASFEEAECKAEEESKEYALSLEGVDYIEWVDVFHLFDERIGDKVEVYSRLTASELEPAQYVAAKYYDGKTHKSNKTDK